MCLNCPIANFHLNVCCTIFKHNIWFHFKLLSYMCELLLHCVCVYVCTTPSPTSNPNCRWYHTCMESVYGHIRWRWRQSKTVSVCKLAAARKNFHLSVFQMSCVCVDSARDEYIGVKNYDISSFLTLEFSDSTRVSLCCLCREADEKYIPNPGSP